MEAWVVDFKDNALYRIDENSRMIDIAFAKMEAHFETDAIQKYIWQRPNEASNSLGNQLLHLCGNMTQYIISSVGEQADNRMRDEEFETKEGYTKRELLAKLHTTLDLVKDTIDKTTEEQLLRKRNVQGFNLSGLGCILHAVEHYSYHTGQIAFWIKQLLNTPLGFYDGLDLNELNK